MASAENKQLRVDRLDAQDSFHLSPHRALPLSLELHILPFLDYVQLGRVMKSSQSCRKLVLTFIRRLRSLKFLRHLDLPPMLRTILREPIQLRALAAFHGLFFSDRRPKLPKYICGLVERNISTIEELQCTTLSPMLRDVIMRCENLRVLNVHNCAPADLLSIVKRCPKIEDIWIPSGADDILSELGTSVLSLSRLSIRGLMLSSFDKLSRPPFHNLADLTISLRDCETPADVDLLNLTKTLAGFPQLIQLELRLENLHFLEQWLLRQRKLIVLDLPVTQRLTLVSQSNRFSIQASACLQYLCRRVWSTLPLLGRCRTWISSLTDLRSVILTRSGFKAGVALRYQRMLVRSINEGKWKLVSQLEVDDWLTTSAVLSFRLLKSLTILDICLHNDVTATTAIKLLASLRNLESCKFRALKKQPLKLKANNFMIRAPITLSALLSLELCFTHSALRNLQFPSLKTLIVQREANAACLILPNAPSLISLHLHLDPDHAEPIDQLAHCVLPAMPRLCHLVVRRLSIRGNRISSQVLSACHALILALAANASRLQTISVEADGRVSTELLTRLTEIKLGNLQELNLWGVFPSRAPACPCTEIDSVDLLLTFLDTVPTLKVLGLRASQWIKEEPTQFREKLSVRVPYLLSLRTNVICDDEY